MDITSRKNNNACLGRNRKETQREGRGRKRGGEKNERDSLERSLSRTLCERTFLFCTVLLNGSEGKRPIQIGYNASANYLRRKWKEIHPFPSSPNKTSEKEHFRVHVRVFDRGEKIAASKKIKKSHKSTKKS